LKPSNVMLESTKRGPVARVLDFGIAKIMERDVAPTSGHTATDARYKAFSPAYAAPEQISGMRTGPWTDVHALGLMLTELLTDAPPYPPGDANDLYRSVFDPERPTPRRRGVDAGAWEPVIERALAIKPNDRPRSARELLEQLEAGLASGEAKHVVRASYAPSAPGGLATAPTVPSGVTERSGLNVEATPPHEPSKPRPRARRVWFGALGAVSVLGIAGVFGARWLKDPSPPTVSASKCESDVACTARNNGDLSVCGKETRTCVRLASEDCVPLLDPRAAGGSKTVWIGALFARTGPDAQDYGALNLHAADLARRDFSEITSGLAALSDAPAFGLLACDDAADARRAAAHIVEVGAPAVIGFRSGAEAIDLAESIFIPHDVLAISSTSGNPLVTTVPHPEGTPRLVWRTTYNLADTGRAISTLVASILEPQWREAGGARAAMRIAFVRPKNVAGAALSESLFKTLHFNSKSALENGPAFHEFSYASEEVDAYPELDELARALVAFAPHVILYVGGAAILDRVFVPLEQRWPRHAALPRYVSFAGITAIHDKFLGVDAGRRRRWLGVTTVSATSQNARFLARYRELFPADAVNLTDSPNSTYDAFYVLAYGSYASQGRISGSTLSRAIARLVPPGRPVDVGMTGIFDAITALRSGKSIDLTGAAGNLDFDLRTGEIPFDESIICAATDDETHKIHGIESGLVYRAAQGRLEGSLSCP
jgi:branched-chain amino acid transport system substrate-binding protein